MMEHREDDHDEETSDEEIAAGHASASEHNALA